MAGLDEFSAYLGACDADDLVALLERRGDLAVPAPSSMRVLAARATSRASLERALARCDAAMLAAIEALVVLPAPVRTTHVTAAVGAPATEALERARTMALTWSLDDCWHVAPGLTELLGPHPAGLGPALTRLPAPPGSPSGLPSASDEHDTQGQDPTAAVTALLLDTPPAARAVLDALTWGPPVGRRPERGTTAHEAVTWLLRHGLLATGDAHHVVLPREVALVLREGRVTAEPPVPPSPESHPIDPRVVSAESATHALEAVRLVGALLAELDHHPASSLRAGGLGVRELGRISGVLEAPPAHVTTLVEVAGRARLIADDDAEPAKYVATTLADQWSAQDVSERWADLAQTWFTSDRASWLVGSRDQGGAVLPALDPAIRRSWLPRVRAEVLEVLAEARGALSAAQVHEVLSWRGPRNAPQEHTVAEILSEAEVLGVTGAGMLSSAGHAVLARGLHEPNGTDPAEALTTDLPEPVDEVLLGADLTGVVPGRPSEALTELLESSAHVESRGGGLTVRFTESSIRTALDSRSGDQLLEDLAEHARGHVPQPLEYLIADAMRRHGQVRTGAAAAYVRGDPAALAPLPADPRLSRFGLRMLAPGVLVADAGPAALLEALREAGVAVVAEDQSGQILRAPTVRRLRVSQPVDPPIGPDLRHLQRVATALLSAGEPAGRDATGTVGETPPEGVEAAAEGVEVLAVLREAVAKRSEVWLRIAEPTGTTRRRVRPLYVDGGRVRVLDTTRDAELTVAVHRLVAAVPVDEAGKTTPQVTGEAWTDH